MTAPAPSTTHACPGACGRQVGHKRYACRTCWYRLPFDLRNTITGSYRAGDRLGHRSAMRAAHEWYKAHRPGVARGSD